MLVGVEVTSLINIQESEVLHDSRIELTRKLHILEAHLLHYQSLLDISIFHPGDPKSSHGVRSLHRGSAHGLERGYGEGE
jgi:hypothetical protein